MVWGKIKKLFKGRNLLYYPGCLTHFAFPQLENNYKKILNMLEIDFIFLPDFNCCGSPVLNAGYTEDFEELMESNRFYLEKYGVGRIVTSCPACYLMLKDKYGADVEHISQTIMRNIDKLDKSGAMEVEGNKITYHDPCHLGRKGSIYDEPRQIIRSLGLEVVELPCSRSKSLCCGAGGGLKSNNPSLARDIAKSRLKLVKTKTLVTTCPMCYAHFREQGEKMGIKVLEFSQLLLGK